MKKPNFIIAGAAKAGTTSIYHYLNNHPDVYMSPIKEPHYFCKDIRCRNFSKSYQKRVCFDIKKYLDSTVLEKKHITYVENLEDYCQLFREIKEEKIAGEASVGYLYSQVAAEKIYEFNSDMKIVIFLRNPVERAFSHWVMNLRGKDVCRSSFLDAVKEDQAREEKGWGKSRLYIELGLYYDQVKRYLDIFPREQVLILLYDDLCDDSSAFFKQLFEFLRIAPSSIDASQRYNKASIPKYPALNGAINKMKINKLATKFLPKDIKNRIKSALSDNKNLPKLTSRDRDNIQCYFDADIVLLEKLIDRNLSAWR